MISDVINAGALSIGGANLTLNRKGTFNVTNTYTIANFTGGLTGTLAGLAEGAFIDGYQISYGGGMTGSITLTAVPEPGTLGLLGLALAGFFTRRIRKRRAEAARVESGSGVPPLAGE